MAPGLEYVGVESRDNECLEQPIDSQTFHSVESGERERERGDPS